MFTGIIEGLGTVKAVIPARGGLRMRIYADFSLDDVRIGDSIAVSGPCLTVVNIQDKAFEVDVAPETLSKTTLGQSKVGDRVNLERALCLGDRLSGHLVTGHIDGIGQVEAKRPAGNATLFTVGVPEELARYIVQKGSVALDGISLTVNACTQRTFEVSIIPHTANITTMGLRKVGDRVNIETDMVAKYIERFTQHTGRHSGGVEQKGSSVDKILLKETGFV